LVERRDGGLEIVDFDRRRSVATLPKPAAIPVGIREFPEGRRAVLLYPDRSLEIWDATAARLLKRLVCPVVPLAAKASPDGRLLAVSFNSSALSVWDTETWTERSFQRAGGPAQNLSFSADGARLLAGTWNDTAEVWDARSGKLMGMLMHSSVVEDASYSPDGHRIVTASDDRMVRIWDAVTLRQLTSLEGHKRFVIRARFTDDGGSIVSVDDRGTAMMWLTKMLTGAGSTK
jgi:WD40 repeat protein